MNILIVGQSHVAAVRDAARTRREADPERPRTRVIHTLEPRYAPELDGDDFTPPLAEAVRDQIARHRPLVASVMGGNFHNALALIRHPRPWDFRLSGEADLPPGDGTEPIPQALVRAALEEGLARDRARLTALRAVAGPFVHIESPPPLRDDALVAAGADAYFLERGLAPGAVAPASLRWRTWRLNGRLFREQAERLGCRFLPAPPETQDVDGFLVPAFAGDSTHGNAAYGEAVIRALERFG